MRSKTKVVAHCSGFSSYHAFRRIGVTTFAGGLTILLDQGSQRLIGPFHFRVILVLVVNAASPRRSHGRCNARQCLDRCQRGSVRSCSSPQSCVFQCSLKPHAARSLAIGLESEIAVTPSVVKTNSPPSITGRLSSTARAGLLSGRVRSSCTLLRPTAAFAGNFQSAALTSVHFISRASSRRAPVSSKNLTSA